jgi:uncharacterized protein YndB with AHSA1/START domain
MEAKNSFRVLKDEKKVVMIRIFDAPRELVWKAYTDPELMKKWWGPRNLTTIIEKMDVEEGGEWRYIHKEENGNEHPFHGVYKEIREPEKISRTFNYEPIGPGHEMVESAEFEELGGGKTKVIATAVFVTVEDLGGMVNSGMEWGEKESFECLTELLIRLKK